MVSEFKDFLNSLEMLREAAINLASQFKETPKASDNGPVSSHADVYRQYVGRYVKAFPFSGYKVLNYHNRMQYYEGKFGQIVRFVPGTIAQPEDKFVVQFYDGQQWSYPANESLKHIFPDVHTLVGRKIKGFKFEERDCFGYHSNMDAKVGLFGEIMRANEEESVPYFDVKFEDGKVWSYPITEALNYLVDEVNVEEPTFEKGQPVWVKNNDSDFWYLRYYSHKDGKIHFCFNDQKKEGNVSQWKQVKPFEGKDPNAEQ